MAAILDLNDRKGSGNIQPSRVYLRFPNLSVQESCLLRIVKYVRISQLSSLIVAYRKGPNFIKVAFYMIIPSLFVSRASLNTTCKEKYISAPKCVLPNVRGGGGSCHEVTILNFRFYESRNKR